MTRPQTKFLAAAPAAADRRRIERNGATGWVRLAVNDDQPRQIAAALSDVSPAGFRALYSGVALPKEQEVAFRHSSAQGTARVLWSRATQFGIQSGFVIVRAEKVAAAS